jgi:hypothetical protein
MIYIPFIGDVNHFLHCGELSYIVNMFYANRETKNPYNV